MRQRVFIAVVLAAALSACATPQTTGPSISADSIKSEALAQQRYVIDQRLGESRRVDQIHSALSVANLEFCKIKSRSIGAEIYALNQYGKSFREAAKDVGLTDAPTIAYVLDKSPASDAGLRPGDRLLEVDGKAYPQTNRGARQIEKAISRRTAEGPMPIKVMRGSETLTLSVAPVELCGYPIAVAEGDELNAYADGGSIVLYRRMLLLVENDEQLALIIGHELAHNAMGHLDAQRKNQALGMFAGALADVLVAATTGYAGSTFTRAGGDIGAGAYSKEFESEADYAGMYFIARAGFRLDGVENVWRRMSLEYPRGINFGGDHPTNSERYVALASARDEIIATQTAGLALRPKMKGDANALAAAPSAKPAVISAESEATPPQPAALVTPSAN